jgi:anti-anti-sigma regulatory factor
MRVFLSWSGGRSRAAANALKAWLMRLMDDISVWMSEHDIAAGAQWGAALHEQLKQSDFGVLCLTAENIAAPWILYEAGALAVSAKAGCVVPFLIGVGAETLGPPLSLFQSVEAGREGAWKVVRAMNQARECPADEGRLREAVFEGWPWLAGRLGLGVEEEMHGDVLVLRPGPNHLRDDNESGALRGVIWGRIKGGQRRLVLDLSRVEHASSTGLSVLMVFVVAQRRGQAEGVIAGVARQISEALEVMRITELLRVFPTLEAALAHFGGAALGEAGG